MRNRFSPEPLRVQVGLLLSGCGHYDGADVQEAVLCGCALDRRGARVVGLAPEREQLHVVDHTRGDEMAAPVRNLLLESARILHDKVHAASEFALETLQGLVVPGGFGCAKNLMTSFARPGERRDLHPDVKRVLSHFLSARKPLGIVGLGEIPVRHLLGLPLEDAPGTADPLQVSVDRERRIVTTPGFKGFTRVSEVAAGVEAMVEQLMALLRTA
jgi:enhancing lycopene biosynthesis protein 2